MIIEDNRIVLVTRIAKNTIEKVLFYDFSFLPAQVLPLAFSAFDCCFSVACATVSQDFMYNAMFARCFFSLGLILS